MFLGNGRARVAHGQADRCGIGVDADIDDLARRGVLYGIVDQVDQRATQMRFLDARAGIAVHLNPDLRVFEYEIQVVEGRGDFFGQGGGGQFSGLATLVGTGQEEHVVDDAAQALEFFEVRLQHFEIVFGRATTGECDLGLANEVGQGGAQFVGDVGVEGFEPRVGQVDPFQGGVEGTDELAEFRWQRRQLQTPGQARRCQLLGFLRQRHQWLEADARHPVTQGRGQHDAKRGQADQGNQQSVLGVAEGFGIDTDQKCQGGARCQRRQVADQHFVRVGLARQVQVAHAVGALGKPADRGIRLAVFVGRVAADHPEADAFVFFTEQVELVVDLGPVLKRAVAGQGRFQHAVACFEFGFGE
ncbi:hypothetical protein D3C85_973960 [compost metagenome]